MATMLLNTMAEIFVSLQFAMILFVITCGLFITSSVIAIREIQRHHDRKNNK